MNVGDTSEPEEASESEFKASDLLKLAGLTYRQLSDWENRAGILNSQRATDAGWRKFTAEDVLALSVCASLRRQFSVPLEKVGGLFRWLQCVPEDSFQAQIATIAKSELLNMSPERKGLITSLRESKQTKLDTDDQLFFLSYLETVRNSWQGCPIRYAYKCAEQGETVYLYTDFETSLILFEDQMADAIVKRLSNEPFMVSPLNNVFDELRKALGKPPLSKDKLRKSFSVRWQELNERITTTEDERKVLSILRKNEFQRVTVHLRDGRILRAECEEELSKPSASKRNADILEAIKGKDFATVTVQRTDGEIVRLTRKSTVKFDNVAGKT